MASAKELCTWLTTSSTRSSNSAQRTAAAYAAGSKSEHVRRSTACMRPCSRLGSGLGLGLGFGFGFGLEPEQLHLQSRRRVGELRRETPRLLELAELGEVGLRLDEQQRRHRQLGGGSVRLHRRLHGDAILGEGA
eukprot:scaffold23657_cov45-Phaeocystis_antarctica.AAC.1